MWIAAEVFALDRLLLGFVAQASVDIFDLRSVEYIGCFDKNKYFTIVSIHLLSVYGFLSNVCPEVVDFQCLQLSEELSSTKLEKPAKTIENQAFARMVPTRIPLGVWRRLVRESRGRRHEGGERKRRGGKGKRGERGERGVRGEG